MTTPLSPNLYTTWRDDPNEEWILINNESEGYFSHNSDAIKERVKTLRNHFFKLSVGVGAALYKANVGGFLFEHGVAFWVYTQQAPQSLWAQYFYANAAHEAAMQIFGYNVFGVISVSHVATIAFAIVASVVVIKIGVAIYNAYAAKDFKEYEVVLSITDLVKETFSGLTWFAPTF
jgi:hypothetical protein